MKKTSIVVSSLQVSVVLLLIKVLGVLKQAIVAAVCGATAEADAYFVASGVITALCSVIFSSISISLLSIHTNRLITEGRRSANNLINAVLRIFLPISAAVSVFFFFCSPLIAKFLAPSYQGIQLQTLSHYISVLSIMFVFSCFYLIINVVLETDKRFLPGKGYGLLQNLFICIAALLFYPRFGVAALIYALLFAGFIQCIQILWNAKNEFHFLRTVQPEKADIRTLLRLSLPLLVGNAIYEINDIVDKQIATSLESGSVSYLSYGASINEIVTTLIISSVSTVLISHYATWVTTGEIAKIGESLKKSMEYLVILILPVMVMCLVCGDDIVTILYARGNFDSVSVSRTASVVWGYATGFLFQAARANIVRVYYAFQDTKTPMINGAVSVAVNVVVSVLLSRIIGVGGIALATSAAMLLVSALLLPGIKQFIPGFSFRSSVPECIKAVLSAIVVGVSAYFVKESLPFEAFASFVIIGIFVVTVYFGLAIVMDISDVKRVPKAAIELLKNRHI